MPNPGHPPTSPIRSYRAQVPPAPKKRRMYPPTPNLDSRVLFEPKPRGRDNIPMRRCQEYIEWQHQPSQPDIEIIEIGLTQENQ